jgi:hypothetical protein
MHRAAIHDKVRGSLSSLQESLALSLAPGLVLADSSSGLASGSEGAGVNPKAGVDDDLAARIARIRNVNKK